jgi:hypothetical protein
MRPDAAAARPAALPAREPFPPAAYLIGAQKCATTFLADALDGHPELDVARPKEPDFFTVNRERDWDWYRACFPAEPGRVLLDASTSYTMAPTAAEERTAATPTHGVPGRIAAATPDARIVYVVRDPVQRTYSAYWHDVRTGYEDRPFLEALAARSWYLDGSRYHFQIRPYVERFGRSRVLILTMAEVVEQPATTRDRVWRFLGLDPVDAPPTEGARNASHTYTRLGDLMFRNPRVRRVTKPLAHAGKRLLPAGLYDRVRAGLTRSIPPMSARERAIVADRLADDMAEFAALTGIDYRTGPGSSA